MNPLDAWDTGNASPTSTEVRSPTSTRTEVRSPTSTQTDAYTQGNFTATVTGGAGAGSTTVNIHPGRAPAPAPRRAPANPNPQAAWSKLFAPSDTAGLEDTPSASFPLLFIIGVGGVLLWAVHTDNRKRRAAA